MKKNPKESGRTKSLGGGVGARARHRGGGEELKVIKHAIGEDDQVAAPYVHEAAGKG